MGLFNGLLSNQPYKGSQTSGTAPTPASGGTAPAASPASVGTATSNAGPVDPFAAPVFHPDPGSVAPSGSELDPFAPPVDVNPADTSNGPASVSGDDGSSGQPADGADAPPPDDGDQDNAPPAAADGDDGSADNVDPPADDGEDQDPPPAAPQSTSLPLVGVLYGIVNNKKGDVTRVKNPNVYESVWHKAVVGVSDQEGLDLSAEQVEHLVGVILAELEAMKVERLLVGEVVNGEFTREADPSVSSAMLAMYERGKREAAEAIQEEAALKAALEAVPEEDLQTVADLANCQIRLKAGEKLKPEHVVKAVAKNTKQRQALLNTVTKLYGSAPQPTPTT